MTGILLKPASSVGFLLLLQTFFDMRPCAASLDRLHLGIKLWWEANDVGSVSVPCYVVWKSRVYADKQIRIRLTIRGS